MNRFGFSLIELVVIVSIIGILSTIGAIDFNSWRNRSNVDKQAKELYADIMNARHTSLTTKRNHGIVFGTSVDENPVTRYTFKRYSSDGIPETVIFERRVTYPITKSNWANPEKNEIEFDERGIMIDPIDKNLCIFSMVDPPLNALVVTQTRVGLGKIIDQGAKDVAACRKSNVDLK